MDDYYYNKEIVELTELLQSEFHELRQLLLDNNFDLNGTLLVAYVEDKQANETGIFMTKEKDLYFFKKQLKNIFIKHVQNIKEINREFPQVDAAVNMM